MTTSQLMSAVLLATPRALTYTVASTNPLWTVWHTEPLPDAILALATQADQVWVGTRYGIWGVDPAARHIEKYNSPGGAVSLLLPIEDGQVWAGSNADLYFFDGEQWQKTTLMNSNALHGGSTYGAFDVLAIDVIGDLWVEALGSRGDIVPFHYSGHVPATGDMQRGSTDLEPAQTNCQQLTALASLHNQSYHSSAECLALQPALQLVPLSARGVRLVFDADDSLWGVNLDNGEVSHWSNGDLSFIKLPPGRVNALTADPTHGVWIGTDRGLMYTDGQVVYQMPGLDRHFTGGRRLDRQIEPSGNVWVLTSESKLSWLPDD